MVLTKLEDRRYGLCKLYVNKILNPDHKLHHLLPDERIIPNALRPHIRRAIPKCTYQSQQEFFYLMEFSKLSIMTFDFTVTI